MFDGIAEHELENAISVNEIAIFLLFLYNLLLFNDLINKC